MIGNTGDTQPVKVPGLPLCIRFRGKPDDLKKFPYNAFQNPEKNFAAAGSPATKIEQTGPLSDAPPAAGPIDMAPANADLAAQAADTAETCADISQMAQEEQPEDDLLVVRPRSAERRAEDFVHDWMRRFTRA